MLIAPDDRKYKIAYFVSMYPAISHTFILREATRLRTLGFEIDFASINLPDRPDAAMTDEERLEKSRTYYIKSHGILGALIAHMALFYNSRAWLRGLKSIFHLAGWNLKQLAYCFFYFTEALMIARWMRSKKINHLHVHFGNAAATVGMLLKQMMPISLSITVHGPDEFYDAKGQWLLQKIESADFMICISKFARSQLMFLSPQSNWEKFEVCPLGVEFENIQSTKKSSNLNMPFTILCVGRLTGAKGQGVLIKACERLHLAGRQFQLVLVGAGPDESALKEAVKFASLQDKVIFTGPLNQPEVRQWYSKVDAFALASFAEGVPVVLMEAMANGVPCVTTWITGIPELIRNGQDGLLVAPSDTIGLAEALARLMDNSDLRKSLALSARARVESHYNLRTNVEHLATVFHRRLHVQSGQHEKIV